MSFTNGTALNLKLGSLKDHVDFIPALSKAFQEEWPTFNAGYGLFSVEDVAEDLRRSARTMTDEKIPITLVVMMDDDDDDKAKLAGSCTIEAEDLPNSLLTPWFTCLYVFPPYRRCGVATRLILEAQKVAVRLGFNELYLFVENEQLQQLYQKFGWSPFEQTVFGDKSITIMHKHLSRS